MAKLRANITEQHKKLFLEKFGELGIVSAAAEAAGVGRTTVYDWQERDEQFVLAFRQAEIRATEVLETEARRRAVEGVAKQRRVYDNRGNLIDEYSETTYSDTLLIFMLKARAPEKYRDRHDITSGGQPIQSAAIDIDQAIDRRLAELAAGSEGALSLATPSSSDATDASW